MTEFWTIHYSRISYSINIVAKYKQYTIDITGKPGDIKNASIDVCVKETGHFNCFSRKIDFINNYLEAYDFPPLSQYVIEFAKFNIYDMTREDLIEKTHETMAELTYSENNLRDFRNAAAEEDL